MRYFLAIACVCVSGVICGVLGWTAGMIMDRYRWLGLEPEEFWHTDPEQVWAWGFLICGAAGMLAASLAAAWLLRKASTKKISTALAAAFVAAGCAAELKAQPQPPPEKPAQVELRWAELRPIAGLTDDKKIQFGEGDHWIYLHKKPVLSNEDVVEARIDGELALGADKNQKVHGVRLILTPEAKQKLIRSGEAKEKKLLAILLDGHNPATWWVDNSMFPTFDPSVGYYNPPDAERIVKRINLMVATRTKKPAADPNEKQKRIPISAVNAGQVRPIAEFAKRVHKIVLGPETGELAFVDFGSPVEIVDDATGRTLRQLADVDATTDLAFSPDRRWTAWQSRNSPVYIVRDIANAKNVEINLGKNMAGFAAFSRDSKLVAIGDTFWSPNAEGEGTSEMKLFDLTGKLVRTLASPGPGAMTPVFSPDGKILAVGNRNYETVLYEVATGKHVHTLPRRMTHQIAFSPDGKVLAAGYVDGAVVLWDVGAGTMLRSQQKVGLEIYALDWNPKGDVLVSAGRQSKIVLWDPATLNKLAALDAPDWVGSVRFTADGTHLFSSGGSDYGRTLRKVVVWAIPDEPEE
jgi:hypothetical protein